MPRHFPDMKSLKSQALSRNFRQPHVCESEENYREAFADYMVNVDRVESTEIRSGRGWDNQNPFEMLGSLLEHKQAKLPMTFEKFANILTLDLRHTVDEGQEALAQFTEYAQDKFLEVNGMLRPFDNVKIAGVKLAKVQVGMESFQHCVRYETEKFRKLHDWPAYLCPDTFVYLGTFEQHNIAPALIEIYLLKSKSGAIDKYLYKFSDAYADEFRLSENNFDSHPYVDQKYKRLFEVSVSRATALGWTNASNLL